MTQEIQATDDVLPEQTAGKQTAPARRDPTPWIAGILLMLLAACFAAGLLFLNFTVDDAYISFRYARNLVDFGIWNWNPSPGDPVEAYTSPLYAFLAILPTAAGLAPSPFFKGAGAVLIAAIVLAIRNMFRERNDSAWLLGVLFFASDLYVFAHAFSGLETLLFYYLVFLALTLNDKGRLADDAWSPLMLVSPLTRPEGAVITAYMIFLRSRTLFRRPELAKLKWFAASLALTLLYLVVHFAYFHDIFPNTFYAKTGSAGGFLANIVAERQAILFGAASLAVLWALGRPVVLPSLLIAMYFGSNLSSDMQMNYGLRFAHHLVLPVSLFAFCLLVRDKLPRGADLRAFAPALVLALSPLTLIEPNDFKYILTYSPYVRQSHAALGQALAGFRSKGYTMAVGDAGLIPYHSGWSATDYIGLADKQIARHIATGAAVKLKAPDLFIMFSNENDACTPHETQYPGEKLVLAAMKRSDYICVLGPRWGEEYYLHVLVRKSLADRKRIAEAVGAVRTSSLAYQKSEKVMGDILRLAGLGAP